MAPSNRPRASATKKSSKEQAGLLEIVQKRMLTDVFESSMKAWPGWTVLVMDHEATRIISSAVGMYDIMERRVMLVEGLEKKRAPFKDKAVIYLLSSTEESVDRLIADFERPLYGPAAFVYFLSRVPDRLVEKIKQCKPLLKVLKTFAELNIDFLAKEMRAFHFDMRSAFSDIYGRRTKMENTLADKLITVCATLNEYPHIRFPKDSRFCQSLAKSFHLRMDEYLRSNPSWWYHGDSQNTDRERATLLILDRQNDCLSPLMHEFTYQALVYDLLPVDDDRITIEAEAATRNNDAQNIKLDILLNENDSLWVELRSKHIADVGQILSGRIREMINSDTTAVASRDKAKVISVQQMSNALRALPEYREVMGKLSQHLRLSQKCWDIIKEGGMVELSDLEQTLATGKDDDGKSPKYKEMVDRVDEELSTMRDARAKIRLVLILIISQGGIKAADKARLWQTAHAGRTLDKIIQNLDMMGIPIISEDERRVAKFLGGKKIKSSGVVDEETEYKSRYIPPLRPILEDLVNHRLSIEEFPSVLPLPQRASASSATAHSLRKRDGSTTKGGTTSRWQKTSQTEKKAGDLFLGGRQLVFYVGGITFSELRVARQVMEKENKEIVVGSTHFIKPNEFIEDVDRLN